LNETCGSLILKSSKLVQLNNLYYDKKNLRLNFAQASF
jgi:hypothetical protein